MHFSWCTSTSFLYFLRARCFHEALTIQLRSRKKALKEGEFLCYNAKFRKSLLNNHRFCKKRLELMCFCKMDFKRSFPENKLNKWAQMEKRMERSLIYNGTITAEQFLFYEIRIASKFYLNGTTIEDAIDEIKKNNLFQYPTERLVARMVRSCYKRLDALNDDELRQELSLAPTEIAKQINLYAMMRYNLVVWDFMVGVIGEKYRNRDFEFSRKDLNIFFSRLREQNDDIAEWSESTVQKIKQVLTKALVEVGILDSTRSTRLNSMLLCEELEEGIRRNRDFEALAAFNCFR